ncbi:MAG: hypothetical protein IPM80_03840 [Proteobacteria bacterium]|nr:hypothetical protein [Pseudomonadota bacterium]
MIHSIAIEAAAARRNEVKGMGEVRKSSGKSAAKGRRDQWRCRVYAFFAGTKSFVLGASCNGRPSAAARRLTFSTWNAGIARHVIARHRE